MPNSVIERLRREAFPLSLFAVVAFTFLPVTSWLWDQTVTHEQLLHAFIILGLALVFLIYDNREDLKPQLKFGPGAGVLLASGLVLAVVAAISHITFLVLPGLILSIAAALLYVLGRRAARFITALLGAFSLYVFLALFMPLLDWPMRTLAARGSAWLLAALGKNAELALAKGSDEGPMLLLLTGNQPFHVAAECNGFGVLAASLLLTLLLVLFKKIAFVDKLLLLVSAAICAFLFNYIRIILIVFLAPVVGGDHYFLMHEIVGVLAYYGCLLLIWWVISGFQGQTVEKTGIAAID